MAPSESRGRRPTVDEAVDFLRQAMTRQYVAECLRHWRERYGDAFAGKVEMIFGSKTRR